MKKADALQILLQGGYIRHEYYSPEEHIHMENGHIIDESDYDLGTVNGEFWSEIQRWEDGWEEVEQITARRSPFGPEPTLIHNTFERLPDYQDWFRSVPQYRRPAPKVHRNEPCTCGSGLKFKNCCGIVK